MQLPQKTRESGFTLIELMVTLAVLAIVLAAAVPSFSDFFDKYRLRGAADGIISLISNARAEAVKTGVDVNIAFNGSSAAWCVGANAGTAPANGAAATAATACDCTDASKCLVSGQHTAIDVGAYPDVTIGVLPDAFVFDSKLGTIVPLGDSAVTLTSPKGKYDLAVKVNALGQAQLCRPSDKPVIAGVAVCN